MTLLVHINHLEYCSEFYNTAYDYKGVNIYCFFANGQCLNWNQYVMSKGGKLL